MTRVYRYVLPGVREQLKHWRSRAEAMPDPELRTQALQSMTTKEFHCIGGCVYAAAHPSMRHVLIPLIVAFQTISDYLDNLCDRSTSLDPVDFRRLHQSMLDAVNPAATLHDYYEFREEKQDADYLNDLVKTCQASLRLLPSYVLVAERVQELVGLYCDLQVYKHIHKDHREKALLDWWAEHQSKYDTIAWNEFAAATGSTLGVFMLFLAASEEKLQQETIHSIHEAYFPYICSLHILLDYLIDQEEDRIGGDLNFCSYYANMDSTVERIEYIVGEAKRRSQSIAHAAFHRMIIEGLLALYLSDPKVSRQQQVKRVSRRLMKGSPWMRLFFLVNSVWIRTIS
ncbi:tetraprenyl-beta-curcumene synthase family protein [Paenibacillus sp. YYML68]|uniref:tetraprenyl-beta-curcumene synthase family protein n=1 Tax=Paenibacillus sp. YYML68 TaxID=2909250 RepID=UPI0024904636|nr:tetraprenyl-beta-curcumene synthase family protein [Paenibacillus sp. YYML68]